VNADHVVQGFDISPLVIGEASSCFDHGLLGVDTLIAFGGCALVNDFDVLAPTAASTQEMRYAGGTPGQNGAVISQQTENLDSVLVGVVLSGFSFHYIRDDAYGGLGYEPDRAHHLRDILVWLNNTPNNPTGYPAAGYSDALTQNYPNPFNPTTEIAFSLSENAKVSLRVYNVRGQLVTTLVDGVHTAGVLHKVTWDGRNRAGESVASGVYFYKLVTKNFAQTRKMVLLK
jgi:hypothetical protein